MRAGARFSTVLAVLAVALGAASVATAQTASRVVPPGASGAAATGHPAAPATAVVHYFGAAARAAAVRHWSPHAMAAAVPEGSVAARGGVPVPLILPTYQQSPGNKVVGALFFSDGTGNHFCTASIITSLNQNLLVSAAHCLYYRGWKANIAFVPGYHNGRRPYGIWPVAKTTLDSNWLKALNQDYDYAFLQVQPQGTKNLEAAVGEANTLETGAKSGTWVVVTGYPNTSINAIYCLNRETSISATEMMFKCAGFSAGTSGGPWDAHYNWQTGAGAVIGVTGGYQQGGIHPWLSYSVRFGAATQTLYRLARQ